MINFKHNSGDSICGDSITGRAGTIFHKGVEREEGVKLKKLEFFKSAVCVINPPITISRKASSKNVVLEGLRGHKIQGKAKKNSKPEKVKKTGGHTQWQTTLKRNAFCIIDIPITSHSQK